MRKFTMLLVSVQGDGLGNRHVVGSMSGAVNSAAGAVRRGPVKDCPGHGERRSTCLAMEGCSGFGKSGHGTSWRDS